MSIEYYKTLGKTEIKISRVGIGIMQWGKLVLNPIEDEINKDITDIYQTSLAGGINFFDTAEMYGRGRSESHLGRCLRYDPKDIVIATKFMPFPWRLSKGELRAALIRSLKRLGVSQVDLYQMHWPIPPVPIKAWMDAMADAVEDGLISTVGVSNYSIAQTQLAFDALAKRKIPLASNQVRYSLLDRRPERTGLVEVCRELGVTIIAYSPLEKGILTGKYSPEKIPSGNRSWFYNKEYLLKIAPLVEMLIEIGKAHQGSTPGQVALNWLMCKDVVPIPGSRNQSQAIENAGSLGWQLSADEMSRLDLISDQVAK
jgi:aryl-alcohol dehydrogenase-like predicted oxidoreductase